MKRKTIKIHRGREREREIHIGFFILLLHSSFPSLQSIAFQPSLLQFLGPYSIPQLSLPIPQGHMSNFLELVPGLPPPSPPPPPTPPNQKPVGKENCWIFDMGGGVCMREMGTICHLGVFTAERSIFWAKKRSFSAFSCYVLSETPLDTFARNAWGWILLYCVFLYFSRKIGQF